MSLRLAVATQQGLDETMAAKVDRYETSDLSERHKVALRIADAMMTQPGLDQRRSFAARRTSTSAGTELLELTLDVMKWNYQKVPVALGVDAEVRPGELAELRFDASGRPSAVTLERKAPPSARNPRTPASRGSWPASRCGHGGSTAWPGARRRA